MSRDDCAGPLSADVLVAWWLGETDAAESDRIEEHLFACAACSMALEEIAGLAAGVRAAVHSGRLRAAVTGAFAQRLAASGLQVREYRVACNGSVNCTVGPDDDIVLARLQGAALAGVDRVDVVVLGADGAEQHRLEDVPFDAVANEVVLAPGMTELRALPATTWRMSLVAVERDARRVLGEYAFHHTPWQGAEES